MDHLSDHSTDHSTDQQWKKKFLFLSLGQAISYLTSSILQIAIVWHLTQQTGSAAIVTTSTLVGYLPRGVLGLFTGVFIDRFDRKKIVVLSDSIIALAALALAGITFVSELPIGLIYVMLAVRSIGSAFHAPAFNAIIPSIVPKDQLARCAGLMEGFESISLILSPALAAVLYSAWSFGSIILLDVAGAAVAVSIVLLTAIPRHRRSEERGGIHLLRETREGFDILRAQKGMLALLVFGALYAFVYFPIGSMYPLITMTYFGGSIRDSSMVEIAFSAGSLAGAFLLGIWGNRLPKIKSIAASIGIYGLGAVGIGLLPPSGLVRLAALSALMGVTIPFFYGLRTAAFQEAIPNEYLGRALSLASSVSLFTGPLGLVAGGAFSDLIGVNICFLALGIFSLALGGAMLAMPSVRRSASSS